jgi:predicted dehydrogenase
MRALVSGAGAAGLLHALGYRVAGVEIAGVFDPDVDRAQAVVDACGARGARVARSFDELCALDAELASVCSPPREHVDQAEALSRGSRVVLVEKPVAIDEGELARLQALPRCVPILQWRAGRALRAVRRAIAHGELGAAPVASCDLAWARDDAYLAARGRAWGCGALLSIGIHAIDALAWALGRRIEGLSGMCTSRRGSELETAAVALLRFGGGAMASLRISIDGGADATRIALCGRGVSAAIEGGEADPTASSVAWSAEGEATLARLRALERATTGAMGPPLLVPYVGGVVDALREGRTPGEDERMPTVESTADAHVAAMRMSALSRAFHTTRDDDSPRGAFPCHANGSPSNA